MRANSKKLTTAGLAVLMGGILALTGCDRNKDDLELIKKELDILLEQTGQGVERITSGSDEVTGAASAEVEKLFTFEYRVAPLSLGKSAADIQVELNKLGAERWDCFDVIQSADGPAAMCKRAPKTYLRYIPRIVP